MAIILTSIFLVILLCGSAVGYRTNLLSVKVQDGMAALAPAATDDMCSTMIKTQGYACEEHTVTTQDGYVLSMQRIPVGRSGGSAGDRPPVLLQHGLLSNGVVWLVLPPDQALAFLLADNGFDVWIANSRGTKYSKGHSSLSPDDSVYWDWSWDELVAYDLLAMFGYVYNETGQKLHYVGHSQGTLMALAALSKNQQSDMWRSASLLAPIAYLGQITSQLVRIGAEDLLAKESYWLDLGEFNREAAIQLFLDVCKPGVNCSDYSSVSGKDCCLNSSAFETLKAYEFQSSTTKNMIHLAQMITEGTVAMYDYNNTDENKKHYGQPTPPVYDMKSIPNDFPLFLCYGGADALSDVKDVQHLLDGLKDHVQNNLAVKFIEKYGHTDFLLAVNAKEEVYDPLMAFLRLH